MLPRRTAPKNLFPTSFVRQVCQSWLPNFDLTSWVSCSPTDRPTDRPHLSVSTRSSPASSADVTTSLQINFSVTLLIHPPCAVGKGRGISGPDEAGSLGRDVRVAEAIHASPSARRDALLSPRTDSLIADRSPAFAARSSRDI